MNSQKKSLELWILTGAAVVFLYSCFLVLFYKLWLIIPVIFVSFTIILITYNLFKTISAENSEKDFYGDINRGANEVTESMVAALAHEIKNPLNSIKGATLYLEDNYGDNNNIKEFTRIIIGEISRLDSYLNEFMSFSRGMKLKLQKSDIINLINGIIMLAKHNFTTEINIKVKKTNIPEILIDQEQIRQVIVNLLSNAHDAVNNTKNPLIEVIVDADKINVYITVKDNGIGINKKDLKKIFTPFYTTKKDGMGIGLNISKTIVKRHSGKINVKSSKNKGTSFTVSIPLKSEVGKRAG